MLSIIRIVLLLFLPVFFWSAYSFIPNKWHILWWDLPKMEKIELISYSLSSSQAQTDITSKSEQKPTQTDIVKNENNISNAIDANISEKPEMAISEDDTNETKVWPNFLSKVAHDNKSVCDSVIQQKIAIDFNNSDINKSSNKIKIFLLGDSMGEGLAYGFNNIKHDYSIEIKSIAKCSTTTYYWNSYSDLEQKILEYSPSVVIIALGTNEWNGAGSSTKLQIMKLHKRLNNTGIKVVWVTPPVEKSSHFFDMVQEIYGNYTYDSRELNVPRGPDHIHPTLNGYITWSRQILHSLNIEKVH